MIFLDFFLCIYYIIYVYCGSVGNCIRRYTTLPQHPLTGLRPQARLRHYTS
nr:MAG TPA: hypothetical protein [Caudoviricetes sp.]